MTLATLQSLLKEARLARNSNATNAFGAAISDIQCAQGRSSDTFDETQILISIRKSRDVFTEQIALAKANNISFVDLQIREQVLTDLLPKVIDESMYDNIASFEITAQGATSMKDMGKVLNAIKAEFGLRIDPAKMSAVVKGLLSGK